MKLSRAACESGIIGVRVDDARGELVLRSPNVGPRLFGERVLTERELAEHTESFGSPSPRRSRGVPELHPAHGERRVIVDADFLDVVQCVAKIPRGIAHDLQERVPNVRIGA